MGLVAEIFSWDFRGRGSVVYREAGHMKYLVLILILTECLLAYPTRTKPMTFGDLGEIVEASYSTKHGGLRVEAGALPLGRLTDEGWSNEYPLIKKMGLTKQSVLSLTSARPTVIQSGKLTLKSSNGKTVSILVPHMVAKYQEGHFLSDGTKLPDGRLYIGRDKKLYFDKQCTKRVNI